MRRSACGRHPYREGAGAEAGGIGEEAGAVVVGGGLTIFQPFGVRHQSTFTLCTYGRDLFFAEKSTLRHVMP